MNHSTIQIANALVQKHIKEIFRIQLEQAVNHLLESELTVHYSNDPKERKLTIQVTIQSNSHVDK